jgi:alkylation response protein AidB-like acyl-CoA dehydrogenase
VIEEGCWTDRALWSRLAKDLDLAALVVPAERGGAGMGAAETFVVMTELGRSLACVPFLSSSVFATSVLLESGDAAAQDAHLPALVAGDSIAAVAVLEGCGGWGATSVETVARTTDAGSLVSGEKTFVVDGSVADLLLVLARDDDALAFFAIRADDPGVDVSPHTTLDPTRGVASIALDAAAGTRLNSFAGAEEVLRRGLSRTAAALAAEQVGVARRALELAVEYSKVREQFGRKIGSFQAIKHKCADMLLEVETAESMAWGAACAIDDADPEAASLAHLALALCSEAVAHVVTETIEVHGGIGFTWEHPAQLYYKRAIATSSLLGSPMWHREKMLQEMGR